MEEVVDRAAHEIANADMLLFHLGAGMSADSGVPVFIDIANRKVFAEKNLTYVDLSQSTWLKNGGQDVFYGFWGNSFNSFREAAPHEGYGILGKWKSATEERSKELTERMRKLHPEARGCCFVYTSNIDRFARKSPAASKSGSCQQALAASEEEIFEIHGDLETWQCSVPCSTKLWTAPSSYRFDVDLETMLLKPKANDFVPEPDKDSDPRLESAKFAQSRFCGPYPRCSCGAFARPSVLMFNSDDTNLWVRKQFAEDNWNKYLSALLGCLRKAPAKIVIVEVGAGVNVPSLRFHGERLVSVILKEYRSCPPPTIVRINPDHPEPEDPSLKPHIIGVQLRALEALKKIEQAIDSNKIEALM